MVWGASTSPKTVGEAATWPKMVEKLPNGSEMWEGDLETRGKGAFLRKESAPFSQALSLAAKWLNMVERLRKAFGTPLSSL